MGDMRLFGTGSGSRYHIFVTSDTDRVGVRWREEDVLESAYLIVLGMSVSSWTRISRPSSVNSIVYVSPLVVSCIQLLIRVCASDLSSSEECAAHSHLRPIGHFRSTCCSLTFGLLFLVTVRTPLMLLSKMSCLMLASRCVSLLCCLISNFNKFIFSFFGFKFKGVRRAWEASDYVHVVLVSWFHV